jgi:hypothetical protein
MLLILHRITLTMPDLIHFQPYEPMIVKHGSYMINL